MYFPSGENNGTGPEYLYASEKSMCNYQDKKIPRNRFIASIQTQNQSVFLRRKIYS